MTEHQSSFNSWLLLSLKSLKNTILWLFLQVYDKGNRCIIDKIQYHRLETSNLFERSLVIRWKMHLKVISTHLKRELNSKTQLISQYFYSFDLVVKSISGEYFVSTFEAKNSVSTRSFTGWICLKFLIARCPKHVLSTQTRFYITQLKVWRMR